MSEKDCYDDDNNGYGDDSDSNVSIQPDTRNISALERILDPSFENKLNISGPDRKPGTEFDETFIGETTVRYYRIRSSKINALFHTTSKEGEALCRDTLATDLETDSLPIRTVQPETTSERVSASATKDDVEIQRTTNECLNKITSSIAKQDEPLSVSPGKLHYKTESNGRKYKRGVEQEGNFSEFQGEKVPEFRAVSVHLAEEPTEEHYAVGHPEMPTASESPAKVSSSKEDIVKYSSEHLSEVASPQEQAEHHKLEVQNEQAVSMVQGEECLLQLKTRREDPEEIGNISSKDYDVKFQSKAFHLLYQHQGPSGTETEKGLTVPPAEGHSHLQTKKDVSSSPARDNLPDPSMAGHALETDNADSILESQIQRYFSDTLEEQPLSLLDDRPSGIPAEEYHSVLLEEDFSDLYTKHLSSAPTEQHFTDVSAKDCISHGATAQFQDKQDFSDFPSGKLKDSSSKHISNKSGETSRSDSGSSSGVQVEILKTQGEVLETKLKIHDTNPESVKDSSKSDDKTYLKEAAAEGFEQLLLAVKMKISEADSSPSEIPAQKLPQEIWPQIQEYGTPVSEAVSKTSLSKPKSREFSTKISKEKLDGELQAEESGTESLNEDSAQPLKAQSGDDPSEVQSEENTSRSPRKETLFYDSENESLLIKSLEGEESDLEPLNEDLVQLLKAQSGGDSSEVQCVEGATRFARNETLSEDSENESWFLKTETSPTATSSTVDSPGEGSHKHSLNKDSKTNITDIVHRTEDQCSTASASHETKIQTKSFVKSVEIGEDKECPLRKAVQTMIIKLSDVKNSDRKSNYLYSAPDDSSDDDIEWHDLEVGGNKNSAYHAGDKIYEFSPFVYVLDKRDIKSYCSSCIKALESTRKTKCTTCSLAFYCNKECQKKHLQAHRIECPHLRRKDVSELPDETIRLVTVAMWKLKDPASQKFCETAGEKDYYYEDLPFREDLCPQRGPIASQCNRILKAEYDNFRKYVVHDSPLSFKEFSSVYAKVCRNSMQIIEDPYKTIGLGMYFGLAAVKLSCLPNASISFIETKMIIVASYDIDQRDKVSIRRAYIIAPKKERQDRNKLITGELCNCELCRNDEFEKIITEVHGGDEAHGIMNALSAVSFKDEKYDEADYNLSSYALQRMSGVAGVCHYLRGQMLEVAAISSLAIRRYKEAVELTKQLLDFYRFFYGPNNRIMLVTCLGLSLSYTGLGCLQEARKYYIKAVQIAYYTYGCEHPFFKSTRYRFISREQGDWNND